MILSTFGIVLGVAAILAIGITNQTALNAVTNLFQETSGKANLIITSNESDGKGFSDNILLRLKSYPGIESAVPSIQVQTVLADENTSPELGLSFFGTDTAGLALYGVDPAVDAQARSIRRSPGNSCRTT